MASSSSYKSKKFDFPVPKDLRHESKARIYGIGIDGDDFVIEFVVYDDLYDAFRLSMNYWIYEPLGGAK
jgi:hypothetical protein